MTLLLLSTLDGSPAGMRVFLSSNAQWAVGKISDDNSAIYHLDPVNRVLLGTTFIAMESPQGITNDGIAFGNGSNGGSNQNAAMVTHTGSFSFLPQPGTGSYPQVAQMVGVSPDGTTPFAQLGHYNADVSGVSETIGWWSPPYPSGTVHAHGYPTAFAGNVPTCASLNGLFIAGTYAMPFPDFNLYTFVLDTASNAFTTLNASTDFKSVACISADGSIQGGSFGSPQQAVYWDATHVMQTIPLPPGATQSVTIGIHDASFIVWSNNGVQRWTPSGGFTPTGAFDPLSFATGTSSTGTFMTQSHFVDGSNVSSYTAIYNTSLAYDFEACGGVSVDPSGPPVAHPKYYVFFPDTNPNKNVNVTGLPALAQIGAPSSQRFYLSMDELEVLQSPQEGDHALTLRYSNDGGANWSEPRTQTLGASGQYLTDVQFRNLSLSRSLVIELSWSSPLNTALSGVFLQGQDAIS